MAQIVFLIGPRGSGKTSIGRRLAEALPLPFLDMDDCIVKHAGKSIADIVLEDGWERFREHENKVLRSLSGTLREGGVVATGGGVVMASENRAYLRENGTVLFLDVPVGILCERLQRPGGNHERPSLLGHTTGAEEEIRRICSERETFYRQTAHYQIHAGKPARVVVRDILALLRRSGT